MMLRTTKRTLTLEDSTEQKIKLALFSEMQDAINKISEDYSLVGYVSDGLNLDAFQVSMNGDLFDVRINLSQSHERPRVKKVYVNYHGVRIKTLTSKDIINYGSELRALYYNLKSSRKGLKKLNKYPVRMALNKNGSPIYFIYNIMGEYYCINISTELSWFKTNNIKEIKEKLDKTTLLVN